MSIDI